MTWSHMLSLVLMGGVWCSTSAAMKLLLYGPPKNASTFAVNFILTVATILLVFDSFVFYNGLSEMSLFGAGFSLSVLLSTIAYSAVIATVAFAHATLSHKEN